MVWFHSLIVLASEKLYAIYDLHLLMCCMLNCLVPFCRI